MLFVTDAVLNVHVLDPLVHPLLPDIGVKLFFVTFCHVYVYGAVPPCGVAVSVSYSPESKSTFEFDNVGAVNAELTVTLSVSVFVVAVVALSEALRQ